MISVRLLNIFEKVTRYPATQLLQDYIDFTDNDVSKLYQFYSGNSKTLNIEANDELDRLRLEIDLMFDVIRSNSYGLRSGEFWDLLEYFEDIRTKLDTIYNMPKYLHSSRFRGQMNSNVQLEHATKQNQTLEQMVSELGSSNPQQDWIDLALRNDLREEDYTTDGGKLLKVTLQQARSIKVTSVFDVMIGDNVYGKDLDKKITFDSVENDLKILNYKDTLLQAVRILAGLRQNDNPEFPQNGIQKALIIGTNQNSAAYPVLLRQLYDTFGNDDTLFSFTLTNFDRESGDAVLIEFNVEAITGEIITETLVL